MKRIRSIVRRVRRIGYEFKATPRRFIRADALDNLRRLGEFACEFYDAIDLIAARERTPIENNDARQVSLKQVTRGIEHDLHHEIVLLDGVLDIFRREKRSTDFIFT